MRALDTCLEAGRMLSSSIPQISMYPFIYPTVGDLFDRLNVRDCLLGSHTNTDDFLGADLLEVLAGASLEQIDELTFISPRQLHLATGMAAWRVASVYKEVIAMINEFHLTMEDDINNIEQMRKERGSKSKGMLFDIWFYKVKSD